MPILLCYFANKYALQKINQLIIIIMSFVQYCINNFTLPIKQISQQSVSLMVPLNADSFLILQTNNKYQCHRIRTPQIIFTGELPKQFVPCQYIRPLINFQQHFIYFINNQASICKLNFKENTSEIRTLVIPDKTVKLQSISTDYKIMDPYGMFLLGRLQNIENKTCTLFVYDWARNVYSNSLSLGSVFFNSILSNFSIRNFQSQTDFIIHAKKFVVVSEQANKIYYNYISWEINYDQKNKLVNSSKQVEQKTNEIILKQTGKKFIACEYFPIVPILIGTILYVIANHQQGYFLVRINMEQSSSRKIKIKVAQELDQKGIIKRYLGIIDGNILFTIFNLKSKHEKIYTIPWHSLENLSPNETNINANLLTIVQSKKDVVGNQIISSIFPSIDGYSFHKYSFQFEKIAKLCRKQSSDFPTQISIETIYRIPKKYFYLEMAQKLQFSAGLIHQILDLL